MTTTTNGMKPGDALIAVGTWVNDGLEIEERHIAEEKDWHNPRAGCVSIHIGVEMTWEYRPKPRKPLKVHLGRNVSFISDREIELVELTPEVRALLEREGLLWLGR